MSETEKLSDMFPAVQEIPMLMGKKAVIGPFTLEHGVWAEETFGSLELFQVEMTKSTSIADKINLVFNMLLNKDDFKDVADFRRNFPITSMNLLIEAMGKAINTSMPEPGEEKAEGEETEKK